MHENLAVTSQQTTNLVPILKSSRRDLSVMWFHRLKIGHLASLLLSNAVKIPPFHGGRYRYGMTGWVKSVLKNKSEEPFKVLAGIVILGAIRKIAAMRLHECYHA